MKFNKKDKKERKMKIAQDWNLFFHVCKECTENTDVNRYHHRLFVFVDAFRREAAHSRRRRLFESSDDEDDDGIIEVAREPAPSSSSGSRSRTPRNNTTIDVEDISDEELPSFAINGSVCIVMLL